MPEIHTTIATNILKVADILRQEGYSSHIDRRLPWLSINDKAGDTVFFTQDHGAASFLGEIDLLADEFDVPIQDAFLYLADTAGVFV